MKDLTIREKAKNFGKGLLTIGLYFLMPIFFSSVALVFIRTLNLDIENFWVNNFANLFVSLSSLAILLVMFYDRLKEEWAIFKKNKKGFLKTGAIYWICGLGIMSLTSNIIGRLIDPAGISANEAANYGIMQSIPIYAIIAIIFTGPIIEEIVFRASFKNSISNSKVFALITGLFFAAIHLMASFESFSDIATNWTQLLYIIPYGALGVSFGLAYHKTKTIFTTISFHILHNFILTTILYLSWSM